MPGTTDTKKAKVPLGSFIMNYGSSRMYPELEPLARMFSADKDDMSKSQNVILTNGEIYFPPDAVEAIGVEKLEYMNNKSKDGAHDAIDREMAMNLSKSIKPMYGGGSIMPMGTGGMLDNYAGGGSIMDQYGHGGKVKKNLKPVPQGNPGLGKLPEAVRNKMGYMREGGEVEGSLMEMMYGGRANKKKKGYQDGGPIGPPLPPEMMGQAMNQQLSDSIDMRMQNPQGGELGVVRQESDAIEAAMKDNLARNARLALQKMRLDSILSESSIPNIVKLGIENSVTGSIFRAMQDDSMQPETLEPRMLIPQELIQDGQSLDIRDYDKSVKRYLESEYGPQNTLRGILRAMPYLPK